jgi:hypothetical protein
MQDLYQIEEDSYTTKELGYLALAIVCIFIEIATMWTWCQWFTNCPKS